MLVVRWSVVGWMEVCGRTEVSTTRGVRPTDRLIDMKSFFSVGQTSGGPDAMPRFDSGVHSPQSQAARHVVRPLIADEEQGPE